MPFYHSGTDEAEDYLSFATLPLPEAAVVIDVREHDAYHPPLLDYLAVEVEDLARELRLHQVLRWRHLAECIDFLKLDVLSLFNGVYEDSDFLLKTRAGKEIVLHGREEVAGLLGRDYLDRVRNQHIHAINDVAVDFATFDGIGIDPEQPLVRVLFLADLENSESVTRAGFYARWLKAWIEEQHGPQRFNRDTRIHTTLVCLNVGAQFPRHLFTSAIKQHEGIAIDTVMLLQKYRDDSAYVGGEGQHYHTELLLYTLLIHWPQEFHAAIDDAFAAREIALVDDAYTLPCPTYTLGIAAMEYSSRWATRWVDYGIVAKLLTVLNDATPIEKEESWIISTNIHKWIQNWWSELQSLVPQAMMDSIEELQVYERIAHVLASNAFVQSTPLTSVEKWSQWTKALANLYTGQRPQTLEYALEHAANGILQQSKWEESQRVAGQDDGEADDPYRRLTSLYDRLERFLALHFQSAQSALPRALKQLSAMAEEAKQLDMQVQNPPSLEKYRLELLDRADESRVKLEQRTRTWTLPVVGTVLRTTAISVLLVALLGLPLVFGIDWYTLLLQLIPNKQPVIQFSLAIHVGITILLVLLLCGLEWSYLAWRDKQLRAERVEIKKSLTLMVRNHLERVDTIIAADVAVQLLRQADLYPSEESIQERNYSSPYQHRLKSLEGHLQTAREHAAYQQEIVDQRLTRLLGQQYDEIENEQAWPSLNTRTELLNWEHIEDAFLQSYQELTTHPVALNTLGEMLLRRLGTEKPPAILKDILYKQARAVDEQLSGEERFRAVHLMLITLLLSLEVMNPTVQDLLPVLQEYVALKEQYLSATPVAGIDAAKIQRSLKRFTLSHAIQKEAALPLLLKQDAPIEAVLAGWVGYQHEGNQLLTKTLITNSVVERLAERDKTLLQALDTLRRQCTLLGYADELAGEDRSLFFVPPGEISDAFLRTLDPRDVAPVRIEQFPDKEKLVYLHIHRIRQLSNGLSVKNTQ